ncbi:MAG: hypothetical protein DIU55_010725 [Bacillota bacterium]|nr:MAG: hypothetical protein DIU69_01230 [Bacillota bacterium]
MAISRAEVLSQARAAGERLIREWIQPLAGGPSAAGDWAVALAGSGATGYRDAASRLDLLVAGPTAGVDELRRRLAARSGRRGPGTCHKLPAWAGGGKLVLLSWDELEAEAGAVTEAGVALLASAEPLYDPQGRVRGVLDRLFPLPASWYRQRIAERYRCVRRRTASIAWNLRRAQAFAFLASFVEWLDHVLHLCLYADGQPPVERKWLLQAAMRTSLGRELRADLYDLFSRLGEVATLGGSYDPKENRLYNAIAGVHGRLAVALRDRGLLEEREDPE